MYTDASNQANFSTDPCSLLPHPPAVGDGASVLEDQPSFGDLVRAQEGMVARSQALAHGMSKHAIAHRLATAQWRRYHPGVYATFTGRPTRLAQLWAALLACSREVTAGSGPAAAPE